MADQPALYSMGTVDSLPRGKRGTGQADHSPPNGSKLNTLRTGDAVLRFYITTVQDG